MLAACAFALVISQPRPALRIDHHHGQPFLVEGRDSLGFEEPITSDWSPDVVLPSVQWGGNRSLEVVYGLDKPDHLVLKRGSNAMQSVELTTLGKTWRAQDVLWGGGHKRANNLRFAVQKTSFGQLVLPPESAGRYALAVAAFENINSLPQVKAEALVRIDLSSPMKFAFIKDLGYVGPKTAVVDSFYPRIFRLESRWYVYDTDGLHDMSPKGQIGKLRWPREGDWYPLGLADGKYLIFGAILDSLAKWMPESGFKPLAYHLKLDPGRWPVVQNSRFLVTYDKVIDAATGRSIPRPKDSMIWRSHIVQWDGHIATVYDAATGKLQKKLRAEMGGGPITRVARSR